MNVSIAFKVHDEGNFLDVSVWEGWLDLQKKILRNSWPHVFSRKHLRKIMNVIPKKNFWTNISSAGNPGC